MKKLKGTNGASIVINYAEFKEVRNLKACIMKELLAQKVDIGNVDSLAQLKDKLNNNISSLVNFAKDIILGCEVSDEFNDVVFECLKHCTYNGISIKEQLFDDIVDAREDYYLIVFECIKENLSPFFKSLVSKFRVLSNTKDESQE